MKNKLVLLALFGSCGLMVGALVWLVWALQRI